MPLVDRAIVLDLGKVIATGKPADIVRDPAVIELRGKVVPVIDPAIKPEQVEMTIELSDGRVLRKRIEHAIGSLEKPMSDTDLERKFADLAEAILPRQQAAKVMAKAGA